MSFTNEIKQELVSHEINQYSLAQLSALIKMLGTYKLNSNGIFISVQNENIAIIRYIVKLLKYFFNIDIEISIIKNMKFGKKAIYAIKILNDVDHILKTLKLKDSNGFSNTPSMSFFKNDTMIRSYIAGLFLSSGSINSPENANYHLEIRTNDESFAYFVVKLLKKIYIEAKTIIRREQHVVYVKSSEQIGDFLRVINVSNALMKFEDMRIRRDFKNSIVRLDNCATANDMKTYRTGVKQIQEIEQLKALGLFDTLDLKLQQIANLRIKYPEDSLNDLVDLFYQEYGQTISKSGIAHRFRKLSEILNKKR